MVHFSKKYLGQHFLTNKHVIKAMCENDRTDFDSIIEIGPGRGALTATLSRLGRPLYVIEKDKSFHKGLRQYTREDNIIINDALVIDFEHFCLMNGLKNPWIIGNLPYNISVPLLIKFLQTPSFKQMTLMFQKEVADRLTSSGNKKKSQGRLTALGQNYFHIKHLAYVSSKYFRPPPKVDSTVLRFSRIENPFISLKKFSCFENFLKLAFSQRRKKLAAILLKRYEKRSIAKALSCLKLNQSIRAEALSPQELGRLYASLVTI